MKYSTTINGIPGVTTRVAASDAVQQLADALIIPDGHPANAVMISCEDQNLRYAFEVDPTPGATGLGHILYVGQSLTLYGGRLVNEFRFINATQQTDGIIQVTPLFEIGV